MANEHESAWKALETESDRLFEVLRKVDNLAEHPAVTAEQLNGAASEVRSVRQQLECVAEFLEKAVKGGGA